jgi:CHAT domain-containing protein
LATGLFFTEFYRALASGQSFSNAMHSAKTWLRDLSLARVVERLQQFGLITHTDQSDDLVTLSRQMFDLGLPPPGERLLDKIYQHPYYWAAFVTKAYSHV